MIRRPHPAVLALAALGACATPIEDSPRDGGIELPERYRNASEPAAAAIDDPQLLWTHFADPSIQASVERALGNNRDLRATAARVDIARARAALSGASLEPSLTARLDAQRRRFAFVGLPIGGGGGVFSNTTNQFTFSLDASWELDVWGRLRAADRAANADLAAAAADVDAATLSLAARTIKAHVACVEAVQQLELANRTAQTRRTTEQMVERRFESGVRTALDLALARSDRESAEAAIAARTRARDAAIRTLEVLLGEYPATALDPGATLPTLGSAIPGGLPAELLGRRPDLRAVERRLAAADARHGEAKADRWPRLSLTVSGGTTSNQLEDLLDLDFRTWALGANLLEPIFDGGRRSYTIQLRDAERREAESRFAALLLIALAEVEGALANESTLREEAARLEVSARLANDAANLAADRYAGGLLDVTTLLDTQRRALAAETALIAIRRARLDNRVDLLLALGGGMPDAAASTPTADSDS